MPLEDQARLRLRPKAGPLTATLVADGTSDRVLLPIINFVMGLHSTRPHVVNFAEGLHAGPLTERIPRAVDLYPCELLFIHRDAETSKVADRESEIQQGCAATASESHPIHVIPVRMTESWLLVDEQAIRRAAGNPHGQQPLDLPAPARIEFLPNPKDELFRALTFARNLGARRLRAFRPESLRHRVAELIDDFSQLRALASFRHFELQVAEYFIDGRNSS